MSDVNKVTPISKFAIVNKIAVILNLGDYAKVESFVEKVVKSLGREIVSLNREAGNAEHNYKSAKEELLEKLEDAQASLEDAYTNINPSDLKTNEAQKEFMECYLADIDNVEAVVTDIEKRIEKLTTAHKENLAEIKEEVALREARIKKLSVK